MDRNELERIYDEHASCAFAIFRRFTANDSDARDLLQDWLVKLANSKPLDSIENERAFLMKVAYRHAVDASRKAGSRRRTLDNARFEKISEKLLKSAPDPDREFLRSSLESALTSLPFEQQIAVQLRLWDGLTFAEIADTIGVSTNTAASRYRYGIEKLRDSLRPVYEEFTS